MSFPGGVEAWGERAEQEGRGQTSRHLERPRERLRERLETRGMTQELGGGAGPSGRTPRGRPERRAAGLSGDTARARSAGPGGPLDPQEWRGRTEGTRPQPKSRAEKVEQGQRAGRPGARWQEMGDEEDTRFTTEQTQRPKAPGGAAARGGRPCPASPGQVPGRLMRTQSRGQPSK